MLNRTIKLPVNPKEYIEKLESENTKKKHKGLRKGAINMQFENYAQRKNSVKEIETFGQLLEAKEQQNQLRKNNFCPKFIKK